MFTRQRFLGFVRIVRNGSMRRINLKAMSRMIGMIWAIAVFAVPAAYGGWTQLKAIYGGYVGKVVIDASGDLYCIAGGVYKSTDGGLNWVLAQGNLSTRDVGAIAAHPVNAGVLYLYTDQGLFKTVDGGSTWTPSGEGLPVYRITYIVISPAEPETIYVATAGDGVYKSTDGGASWAAKNSGLQKTSWCGEILPVSVAVDPNDASRVYANVHRSYFHISTDGGESWTQMMSVWGGEITVSRSNPNVLYSENDGTWGPTFHGYSLIRSTDRGMSWHGVATPHGAGKVSIDPIDENILYVSMGVAGLYKSTDGGANWTSVLPLNLSDSGYTAIDPTNSSIVYASTLAQGPYKSTDAGQSWQQASTGITNVYLPDIDVNKADPSQVYVSVSHEGLLKSIDAGRTWDVVGFSGKTVYSVVTDPTDPDVVFVSCDGIQKSTDGGASWRRVHSHGSRIAFHPLNPGQMFARTSDWQGGILMSTDYGESWFVPESNYITPDGGYAFHPTDPNRIWVSYGRYWGGPTNILGIAYSTNGGYNWSRVEFGYGGEGGSLVLDPNNPSTLYISDGAIYAGVDYRGVWKSTDSGLSWVKKNTGFPPTASFGKIVLDSTTGWLYVATSYGVFCSKDGAESWNSIGNQGVSSLALTPDGQYLYAGASGGIYLFSPNEPPTLSLTKSAPETATSASTITYTLSYKNTGASAIDDVTLIDYYPDGFSPIPSQTNPVIWDIGTLLPGESGTITFSGIVTKEGSNTLINRAEIAGMSQDVIVHSYASATTHIEVETILSLRKYSPEVAESGSVITYILEYENIGNTRIEDVVLEDAPPAGFSPIGPTHWDIGVLNPGDYGTRTLSGTITAFGSNTLINYATITGRTICPIGTISAFASSTTHIEGKAILILTKSAPATAASGSIITYTLNYRNIGNSKAKDVVLMDYYPAGFTPIPPVSNPIIWDIGTLNPGEFGTKAISGTITLPTNGTVTNETMIVGNTTCPESQVSAYASATTYVFSLSDLVVKNITISPSDIVNEGTWVWILAEIGNIGNKEVRDVSVVFLLDNSQIGATRTIAYIGPGQTRFAGITWKASPSGTYTIKAIVDPEDKIPEISEDNNIGTKTIVILPLPQKGNIAGKIRDANTGNPIGGAYIFCFGPTSGMAISDVNGSYTISNLTPGSYRVLAYKAGYVPQAKNCTVLEGQTAIVNFLLMKGVALAKTLVDDDLLSLFIDLLGDEYDARTAYSIVLSIDDPYEIPIDTQPARFSLSKEADEIIISINKDIQGTKIKLDYDQGKMKITEIRPAEGLTLWQEKDVICIVGNIKKGQIARMKASYGGDVVLFLSPISTKNILNEEEDASGDSIKIVVPNQLLKVYPNPFKAGDRVIKFEGLGNNVTLKIYNIAGELVKTEKGITSGSFDWDTKSDSGEKVASGLYIYAITDSEGRTKKGKIGIIR